MSVDMWWGFAAGAALGALIMAVWMGTIAHSNYEKYLAMKAQAFGLEEQLLDCLEGNVERKWMMIADTVAEPKVKRVVHPSTPIIDLTEVENE